MRHNHGFTIVLFVGSVTHEYFTESVLHRFMSFVKHLLRTVGSNRVRCKHKAEHLKINTGWCRPMTNPLLSAEADSQENYRSSHTAGPNSTPDTQTEASQSAPDYPSRKFTFPADIHCGFRLGELTELTFAVYRGLSARLYQTFIRNLKHI